MSSKLGTLCQGIFVQIWELQSFSLGVEFTTMP